MTQFLEKYTSHCIWRGCLWEGVGDRTELQHIDPPALLAITAFLSRSLGLLNRGPGVPATLGAGFLYRILSLIRLIPNYSVGGLRAPYAGCWLSLPHLVTNWSGLQTNWLPVFTELYNSSTLTFFLWASQFFPHSTCPRSRLYYPDYSSTRCTSYLHRCISYFDSPAGL